MSDTPRTDALFFPHGRDATAVAEPSLLVCMKQYELLEREIAALRDVLSRLIKVHDAMGGKCGTVRIAAEEALAGKAQSEYICTCGIRVTPHKCPTDNGF